ncbi:glycosyltransferase 87 family protein [Kribbella sp. NBC_01245]|uniref:glycosyltransferase 87 family protein n=1 Tax=Kribbella sp. NBC_01245 TaxID=2903578 RepID=UPI002E2BF7F5|nr:glycosyltransferase 87 family protein [Kribbella sp. NBC_01245]
MNAKETWFAVASAGLCTAVLVARANTWLLLAATVLVVGIAYLVTRCPAGKHVMLVLVIGAVLCQLPGLTMPPLSSSDAYRYVWDGRVSVSGNSPYAHVPLDDDLAHLRDPYLFPGLGPSDRSGVTGPPRLPNNPADLNELAKDDPRTKINRPQVPTIYPPVAQLYFAAVALVTPWDVGTLGLQLASAAMAVLLTWLLARELRDRRRDPRWAQLWGWSPMVALETGSAAHVDVLAALLIVAAVIVFARRPIIAAALLGAAASVKLLPLLLLPAFTTLRRRDLATPLVAIGTFIASYLPYVLVSGSLVIGFLPGYLTQENFTERSAVLGLLLPPEARQLPAAAIALGLAILAVRRRHQNSEPVAVTCCWLYGAALLVTTPAYPWYGLPLIALAVLAGRIEWLVVPMASYAAYANYADGTRQSLIYLAATVIVLTATALRSTRRARALTERPKARNPV